MPPDRIVRPAWRRLTLALGGLFVLGGCYSLAEPSFDPGDQRAVLAAILGRGVVAGQPMPGQTACDDRGVMGNSLYIAARMPDEDEPRDVYVHTYRERSWEDSIEEVDACMAEYAAEHPGSAIGRIDIPTYRVFGADWSAELTQALTEAFAEASQAG